MASAGIAELILFIAALLVAASVAGTLTAEVTRLGDAITDSSLDVATDVRTDVEIISSPAMTVYNSTTGDLTLYVRNTGSAVLPTDAAAVDVVLDGRYRTNVTLSAVENGGVWSEGEVVKLTVHVPTLDTGDHLLKLVVRADEEVFRFRT